MKWFVPLALTALLLFTLPLGLEAKEKKKEKKDEAPGATPAPDPSNPVAALAPYISNVDELLALSRGKEGSKPFFEKASGDILILRQEFVVEQEKAATPNLKGMYTAAVQTCDLIGAALEDRSKALGDLKASSTVSPDGKLLDPAKKDNLTQGIHGGSTAKAVGAVVERDRERQAIARGEAQNAANGHSLSAMGANQWNARATQWHEKIAAAYSQIK